MSLKHGGSKNKRIRKDLVHQEQIRRRTGRIRNGGRDGESMRETPGVTDCLEGNAETQCNANILGSVRVTLVRSPYNGGYSLY